MFFSFSTDSSTLHMCLSEDGVPLHTYSCPQRCGERSPHKRIGAAGRETLGPTVGRSLECTQGVFGGSERALRINELVLLTEKH